MFKNDQVGVYVRRHQLIINVDKGRRGLVVDEKKGVETTGEGDVVSQRNIARGSKRHVRNGFGARGSKGLQMGGIVVQGVRNALIRNAKKLHEVRRPQSLQVDYLRQVAEWRDCEIGADVGRGILYSNVGNNAIKIGNICRALKCEEGEIVRAAGEEERVQIRGAILVRSGIGNIVLALTESLVLQRVHHRGGNGQVARSRIDQVGRGIDLHWQVPKIITRELERPIFTDRVFGRFCRRSGCNGA